jgi:hypothetical protein
MRSVTALEGRQNVIVGFNFKAGGFLTHHLDLVCARGFDRSECLEVSFFSFEIAGALDAFADMTS